MPWWGWALVATMLLLILLNEINYVVRRRSKRLAYEAWKADADQLTERWKSWIEYRETQLDPVVSVFDDLPTEAQIVVQAEIEAWLQRGEQWICDSDALDKRRPF